MQFLINTRHYSSINENPNSWMMLVICFIPVIIMDSVSKNMLSCLPRCLVTLITLSSTATIAPVNYFANPKCLTAFITISSNHGLPDISSVSISFHTFKKFVTHDELLPSCTIITVLMDLKFPHTGQLQLIWIHFESFFP